MEGLDIELDRTVLDEIGDPIVHMLRNSIDHGIEAADDARRRASPRAARSSSRRDASETGCASRCRTTARDRLRRVWDKACAVGLVEQDARTRTPTNEILQLTCVPGFSTAEKATKVSGRGVGMDVVKGKIEHLGGTLSITLDSRSRSSVHAYASVDAGDHPGAAGRIDGQTYAIPLGAVNEVLAPDDVEFENGRRASGPDRPRAEVIPLHYLDVSTRDGT